MAIGFSGSNGGVYANYRSIVRSDLKYENFIFKYGYPLEISYFINNICNLRCKHCYVAYDESRNALSMKEWQDVFDILISMGALTFGNVGKEPLLNWNKTRGLLYYFQEKRKMVPKLRFGFVTNGLLLNETMIEDIERIRPDYIDISVDGTKAVHDYIRGFGNYDKIISCLINFSKSEVIDKVFISFTANRLNTSTIGDLVDVLYNLGMKKILISPYVTLNRRDELYLSDEQILGWINKILEGRIIDFDNHEDLCLYIKNDYTTTHGLMDKLAFQGIIDKEKLLVDDYGVIFNKYTLNGNDIYFNYLPWDDFFKRAIRISHDGYVSNCYDMFFKDYPKRALGNVREKSIREILQYDSVLCNA